MRNQYFWKKFKPLELFSLYLLQTRVHLFLNKLKKFKSKKRGQEKSFGFKRDAWWSLRCWAFMLQSCSEWITSITRLHITRLSRGSGMLFCLPADVLIFDTHLIPSISLFYKGVTLLQLFWTSLWRFLYIFFLRKCICLKILKTRDKIDTQWILLLCIWQCNNILVWKIFLQMNYVYCIF